MHVWWLGLKDDDSRLPFLDLLRAAASQAIVWHHLAFYGPLSDSAHEVATALRTADGSIYTGVHVEGSCRRSSICAEGVAMGMARAGIAPEAALRIDAVVSVQIKPAGQFRIIAPCGVCRELISDYSPEAQIWITSDAGVHAVGALDLLPFKTRRAW